jgi:Domain of unknown function (DUF6429)
MLSSEKEDKPTFFLFEVCRPAPQVSHDGVWAWKWLDFEVLNRLCEKGYILDPRNKTKSVFLTEKGMARSKELFDELFEKKGDSGN